VSHYYSGYVDSAVHPPWYRKTIKNVQSYRHADPRRAVRIRPLTPGSVHAKVLPWTICLPTLVLIAQAICLLELGQTDKQMPYPMLAAIQLAWVMNVSFWGKNITDFIS